MQRLIELAQYTSQQFASLAAEFDVRLSLGRTGQCWDNALAESFFATIKRELLGTKPWPSRALARTAIFEWIESWYNLQRLHSSLGYRSPRGSRRYRVPMSRRLAVSWPVRNRRERLADQSRTGTQARVAPGRHG